MDIHQTIGIQNKLAQTDTGKDQIDISTITIVYFIIDVKL